MMSEIKLFGRKHLLSKEWFPCSWISWPFWAKENIYVLFMSWWIFRAHDSLEKHDRSAIDKLSQPLMRAQDPLSLSPSASPNQRQHWHWIIENQATLSLPNCSSHPSNPTHIRKSAWTHLADIWLLEENVKLFFIQLFLKTFYSY